MISAAGTTKSLGAGALPTVDGDRGVCPIDEFVERKNLWLSKRSPEGLERAEPGSVWPAVLVAQRIQAPDHED